MKRTVMIGTLLLALLLAGPIWAHHAAEGIVSDDIWQMIDDNLEEVDSPHLNIDFDDVMNSMRVGEGPDLRPYLVTSIVVYPDEVDMYLDEMYLVLEEFNTSPSGTTTSATASTLFVEVIDLENGFFEIQLWEPVGSGTPIPDTPPPRKGS